jgi:uncharacterized iron-regulated membrane protein
VSDCPEFALRIDEGAFVNGPVLKNPVVLFWHRPRKLLLRKAVFYVHLSLGLSVGLLVSITCLTGSLIVYKPEIESVTLGAVSHIVSPTGRATISLQSAYDAVKQKQPACKIVQAYLHAEPDLAWSFDLNCKPQGRVVVYIDKYRGNITGEDHFQGKWTQWIYDLHVRLLSGTTGETVNGIAALLLVILATTGLVVWWPGATLWRSCLRFEWRARWRRKNYDLHRLTGFFASALLMFVALTGAYFAFPKTYEAIVAWGAHGPSVLLAPRTETGVPRHISLDTIYETAVQAMPVAETTLFTFPQQKNAPYSLRRMLPGDWRRTGDNLVYLDQYTGQVIRVNYHRELSWPIRFTRDIYPLHFGTFGGDLTRILWIILGVAPATLYVTGLLMWWNRSILPSLRRKRRMRETKGEEDQASLFAPRFS